MALIDTLAELLGTGPAARNRVEILLDKLQTEKPEDHLVLSATLRNKDFAAPKLTLGLRKEYGNDVVKDNSVAEWRRRNSTELTGL